MTEWRKTARSENLDLLEFYGRRLVGQFQGMGDALSLPAVLAAFRIGRVPESRWDDMTDRLLLLHAAVVEAMKG